MEILSNFGFDIQLFIAQIVNFLILAFLFKKFLYKPILGVVRKREEEIKKGLENAQKAEKALLSAEEKKDEILNKAAQEAERIISESKKSAQKETEALLIATRNEADKLIKNAKEQAQLEKAEMEKEIEKIAIETSKRLLSSVISELFTDKERDEILKRSISKIQKR